MSITTAITGLKTDIYRLDVDSMVSVFGNTNLQLLVEIWYKIGQAANGGTVDLSTIEQILSDIQTSIVMYQKTKCDGTPIGSPIAVQQTVVVAPVEAKICNIEALADALYAVTPKYNKPKHKEVLSGNSEVIAAGTLNELEVIVRGNVTISIDGINVVYTSGVYKFNADELMNSDFTITPIAPSSAIIKTKS